MTVNLNPASPGSNFRRLTDSQDSPKIQVHRGVVIHEITSSSYFMKAGYSLQSERLLSLRITSGSHLSLLLVKYLWHVTIALSIRAMRACRCPYYRRSLHHTLIIHGLTCYLSLMADLDSALSSFLPYAYAYVAIL